MLFGGDLVAQTQWQGGPNDVSVDRMTIPHDRDPGLESHATNKFCVGSMGLIPATYSSSASHYLYISTPFVRFLPLPNLT